MSTMTKVLSIPVAFLNETQRFEIKAMKRRRRQKFSLLLSLPTIRKEVHQTWKLSKGMPRTRFSAVTLVRFQTSANYWTTIVLDQADSYWIPIG